MAASQCTQSCKARLAGVSIELQQCQFSQMCLGTTVAPYEPAAPQCLSSTMTLWLCLNLGSYVVMLHKGPDVPIRQMSTSNMNLTCFIIKFYILEAKIIKLIKFKCNPRMKSQVNWHLHILLSDINQHPTLSRLFLVLPFVPLKMLQIYKYNQKNFIHIRKAANVNSNSQWLFYEPIDLQVVDCQWANFT